MHRLWKMLIALLAIASLILAACGNDDDADAPAAAPEATPGAVDDADAPEVVDDADAPEDSTCEVEGTLSMFSWENEERMQPLLDGFSAEYPNVNIDFSHAPPSEQYQQRLTLLQGANDLPDVFNTTIPITKIARNGFVADISELDAVQALDQNFQDTYSYDGKVYAYSPSTWLGSIFYNKTLFEEYGLEEPSTLDELMVIVDTFESNGIQAFGFDAFTLWDFALFHYNGTVHAEDPGAQSGIYTGESTFEETYLASLEWVQENFIDTGYYKQEFLGYEWTDKRAGFNIDLTTAMYTDGSWGYGGLIESNPDVDYGWMPWPGNPNGQGTLGAQGPGWSMSSEADNPCAAVAWIEWLGSPEGISLYQAQSGNFLGVTGVEYETPEVMLPARAAAESGEFNFPPVFWGNEGTLPPILIAGIQEMVTGDTTPADVIALLDEANADLVPTN